MDFKGTKIRVGTASEDSIIVGSGMMVAWSWVVALVWMKGLCQVLPID